MSSPLPPVQAVASHPAAIIGSITVVGAFLGYAFGCTPIGAFLGLAVGVFHERDKLSLSVG